MTTAPRYAAFISYAHADRAWARWLHRGLEAYSVPRPLRGRPTALGILGSRIGKVFLDEAELGSSSDIEASIQGALDASGALVVICSPAAAQSPRVKEEIRYFESRGKRDRVFCLIVDGRPSASKRGLPMELDCFPEPLRVGSEPLAADARGAGSRRRKARERIIAGLLGVGFDELEQRELARRNQRLIAISAASLFISVAAITLAVIAVSARDEARAQRQLAELEARRSDRILKFVLDSFQSADPYETNGVEVTAAQILERSRERLGTELANEPEIRRTMRDTMSRVYFRLGEYQTAESLLRQNLSEIESDDPAEEYYEYSGHLANVLIDLGQFEEAESRLRAKLDYSRQQPAAASLVAPLANDLGRLLKDRGRFAEAEPLLREAITLLEGFGSDPETLAIAYNNLAVALMQSGREREAEPFMRRTIEQRTKLFGIDHPYVARAENNMGTLMYTLGEVDQARKYHEAALAKRRAAFGDSHPEVAESTYNVGVMALELQEFDRALELFRRALQMDTEMLGGEHPSVAYDLHAIARTHAGANRWTEVGPLLDRVRTITESKLESSHQLVIATKLLRAAYAYRTGNYAAAESLANEVEVSYAAGDRMTHPNRFLASELRSLAQHALGSPLDAAELRSAIASIKSADRRAEASILWILEEACMDAGCREASAPAE